MNPRKIRPSSLAGKKTLGELLADREGNIRAMREGVRDALLLHKQTGHSIVVWQDGRVVWIPPEEIPLEALPNDD